MGFLDHFLNPMALMRLNRHLAGIALLWLLTLVLFYWPSDVVDTSHLVTVVLPVGGFSLLPLLSRQSS
jgi:hypothetical protein